MTPQEVLNQVLKAPNPLKQTYELVEALVNASGNWNEKVNLQGGLWPEWARNLASTMILDGMWNRRQKEAS